VAPLQDEIHLDYDSYFVRSWYTRSATLRGMRISQRVRALFRLLWLELQDAGNIGEPIQDRAYIKTPALGQRAGRVMRLR
jgi:hypothetical protein